MNRKKTGIILVAASLAVTLLAVILTAAPRGGSQSSAADNRVALINLNGEISFSDNLSLLGGGAGSSQQTMQELELARKDDSLKAVVLWINSPGGSAAASQELYEEVLKLKRSGKKVVASFGEVAASGGYYVGVAADRIVANPATLTGSIGVIAQVPNLQGLYRKLGISQETFKSSPHKDMLSPNRPVTPEEARIMQGVIDDTYNQFLQAVASGRHLTLERVRQLADGRIYTGSQAKAVGLVDELGGRSDAVKLAARLAGIKGEPRLIEYGNQGILELFRSLGALGRQSLSQSLLPQQEPQLYTTIKY